MKKKYNEFKRELVAFVVFAIVLGVFPIMGNAQENNPRLFVLVECMNVQPENNDRYLAIEKDIWKPLHLERIKQGNIAGWFLYKVWFTGSDDSYNYVTVTLFDNPAKLEDSWKNVEPAKVLPGRDVNKLMQETLESRKMVSSSFINRLAFVYPESGPGDFKFIQVDYMKVDQGKGGDYRDVETKIWKPVHNEFIKEGSRVGWSLWGRVFPSGAGLDYQFVTVNYFANWAQIGKADFTSAFSKAHPDKDAQPLMEKTNASRVLVKTELWEVIDKALPQ